MENKSKFEICFHYLNSVGFKARFCQGAKGDKNVHKYISRRVNEACMLDDFSPFNYLKLFEK